VPHFGAPTMKKSGLGMKASEVGVFFGGLNLRVGDGNIVRLEYAATARGRAAASRCLTSQAIAA
jgi:hypothetical protein